MHQFLVVVMSATLFAANIAAADNNLNKPGAAGEAIIATSQDMQMYEQFHFSPAYRAGDFVFVSGVVAEAPSDGPATPQTYQAGLKNAFSAIEATLAAANTTFDQVIKLTTFHVFDSPHFIGDKSTHISAFMTVKDKYLPAPYTAWTAVGVNELFPDRGLVEIELIAHSPAD
jgi:enamine deaminase RidA (YjgF/YER057c/UK114 family)